MNLVWSRANLRLLRPLMFAVMLGVEAGRFAYGQELDGCAPAITNASCTILIDRDKPSSPLPIRLSRKAIAVVLVKKRPLDTVTFDASTVDVATPDASAALFSAFAPIIRQLDFDTSVIGGSGTIKLQNLDTSRLSGKTIETRSLIDQLKWIDREQAALAATMKASKTAVDAAQKQLDDFTSSTTDEWTVETLQYSRNQLVPVLQAIVTTQTGLGLANGLHEAMNVAVKAYAALPGATTQPTPVDLTEIGRLLNEATTNQVQIDASAASLAAATVAARDAADMLSKLDPKTSLSFSKRYALGSAQGGRTSTIKVKAEAALSKKSTDLATIAVTWNDTHWEVSLGPAFSGLVNRSFQNTADIVDGKVIADASGKTNTTITETDTHPSVIPFALAHYRVVEKARYDRRVAFLATGGMGVSPYSGSTDFAAGASGAYRGLVISVLRHYGRDSKLGGDLTPGASLGSSPPTLPVERFWKWNWAIAVTGRIF